MRCCHGSSPKFEPDHELYDVYLGIPLNISISVFQVISAARLLVFFGIVRVPIPIPLSLIYILVAKCPLLILSPLSLDLPVDFDEHPHDI